MHVLDVESSSPLMCSDLFASVVEVVVMSVSALHHMNQQSQLLPSSPSPLPASSCLSSFWQLLSSSPSRLKLRLSLHIADCGCARHYHLRKKVDHCFCDISFELDVLVFLVLANIHNQIVSELHRHCNMMPSTFCSQDVYEGAIRGISYLCMPSLALLMLSLHLLLQNILLSPQPIDCYQPKTNCVHCVR